MTTQVHYGMTAWARQSGASPLEERPRHRKVLLKSRPTGIPEAAHFEITESALPGLLADGQALARNHFLSVDPAMRGWVDSAVVE